ncbi:MAG: PKD domain-containing protein, partial [Candidatus Eisenbacteria bacterium]
MTAATCGGTADQAIRATDADGDAITFSKVSGPTFMTVTTISPGTGTAMGNIHLAPGVSDGGSFSASVAATANGQSDTKSFVITIAIGDPPPTLAQPANMTADEGATANQVITASHPCGASLTFTKVSGPAFMTVTTINATTGNVHLAPGFTDAGTYAATVSASGGFTSDRKSFTITVSNVNRPPTLSQPPSVAMNEGTVVTVVVTGSDPDNDPLTFSVGACAPFGVFDPAARTIRLAPGFNDAGTYTCTVCVSDGQASDCKTFTITVNNVNRAPTLNAIANMTVNEGSTADQAITGSDPDGDALTFTKAVGPTYMTVTTTNPTTGNIHLAPGFSDSGTAAATVTATDNGSPPLSDSKSFTITVPLQDRVVLTQPANMAVNVGTTADQTLTASSPSGSPIVFSKVAGPTFMTVTTVNSGSGTATGNVHLAPGFGDGGIFAGTVRATATTSGVSDQKSLTIRVNRAPTLNPVANMTVPEGATADQAITGSDPDGDALAFSKVAGPTFMTVTTTSPTAGNIHVAPGFADAGVYSATVRASDGSLSSDRSFSIDICQGCGRAPVLNPIANMTVCSGVTADQTITATDPDGDAITFTKASGPTFVTVTTINPTTGNVHAAPGFGDAAGSYPVTVTATDSGSPPLSDSKSFTVTVTQVNRPPVLNQPANMTVAEGATADQTITGTSPCGTPLTFSKLSGPLFMTVTTTGATTGNIHLAPGFSDAGVYGATVTVTNNGSPPLSDSKSFTITVNPVCRDPVADAGGPYQGFVNVPIEFNGSRSFDPNGGPLTFAWDFGDGATAVGVMPNHSYAALGTYRVTLTVTGDCGASVDSTTAEIRPACDAFAFTEGGNRTIRLNSERPRGCVQIEPQAGCYPNEDVILASIVMMYTGGAVTEIHAISDRSEIDSDRNGDGISEITACFRKEDLRQLFSGLPPGQSTPTVTLQGDLTTGGRFQSTLELRVISGDGSALAASVSPNPLNPSATLMFTTTRP